MKVVWSDDAVWALVALEERLARRYSADKATRIVEDLVRRVDRLEEHPQLGRVVPELDARPERGPQPLRSRTISQRRLARCVPDLLRDDIRWTKQVPAQRHGLPALRA